MWFTEKSLINHLKCIKDSDSRIHSIYIRHSSAHHTPTPIIADCDLTVFLNCSNCTDFVHHSHEIKKRILKETTPRILPIEMILLPASDDIFSLCKNRYFFRSKYPFDSWRNIDSETHSSRAPLTHECPLDYLPELAMDYYIIPRIFGYRRKRPLEMLFLRRKITQIIEQDSTYQDVFSNRYSNFENYLSLELSYTDNIYSHISCTFENDPISVEFLPDYDCGWIAHEITTILKREKMNAICDVHIYPKFTFDNGGYIAFEVDKNADPKEIIKELKKFRNIESIRNYSIVVGSYSSTVGRLSYLSRNHVLEPYFYQKQGVSIVRNINVDITYPSRKMIRIKFEEYILCLMIAISDGEVPNYNMFRLLFSIHNAITNGILTFDEDTLQDKYKSVFMKRDIFNPEISVSTVFRTLEDLYDFKPFMSTKNN